MTQSRASYLAVALLAATAAACSARGDPVLTAAPEGLDLSGHWQLDLKASQATRPVGPPDTTPAGADPPRSGAPAGEASFGPLASERMRPLAEIVLIQSDTAVTFRFGGKAGVVVPTTGRTVRTALWPNAAQVLLNARWTEEGLRVQRTLPGGRLSVVETYSRSPETDGMIVTTQIAAPDAPTLTWIYDRVTP